MRHQLDHKVATYAKVMAMGASGRALSVEVARAKLRMSRELLDSEMDRSVREFMQELILDPHSWRK